MAPNFVLDLADAEATLETVGGKGASLARLSAAGLPVPNGFHVTTTAYRRFVDDNALQPDILAALEAVDLAAPKSLEAASRTIRGLFEQATIAADLAAAIVHAYDELAGDEPAVAVRSSATAEDLPEASFAGQQETFLNVNGADELLEAVKRCWASLWTARAIGYRVRQGVSAEGVALAVVVQLLVPAEAAGVLFTANPVTGDRGQVVISAAWGLGEAVVGGLVTPDTLTVDKASGRVILREIADKQVMTVRVDGGTQEQPVPETLRRQPVLDDKTVADLAALGGQIEALYGAPMDVEWAVAAGQIAILQARPVESLSPSELLSGAGEVMREAAHFYTVIQSGTLPTASSSEVLFTRFYNMLVKRKGDPEATAFLFGFDTVTMLAEKSLFDLAQWAKQNPALCETLLHTASEDLAAAWELNQAPAGVESGIWAEWRTRLQQHFDSYGHTTFDFDFVNPTPAETPELALDVVKMYLEGKGHNPYERQAAAAERREQATQAVLARLGWPRKNLFVRLLDWAQRAVPAREDSLADLGLGHPAVRHMLNHLGERFAAAGALRTAEDIYWLYEQEVQELAGALERGEPLPDCSERIPPRIAVWREQHRLLPPAMIPETSRWAKMLPWARNLVDEHPAELKGFAASGGKVTGTARVLFGPEDFAQMQPGDVLVAVTTTPAWTPLFAMASAVVTDIGGPLSHSSIVAREYGIPAVMATGVATRCIHSGQVIAVDGSAGVVLLSNGHEGRKM